MTWLRKIGVDQPEKNKILNISERLNSAFWRVFAATLLTTMLWLEYVDKAVMIFLVSVFPIYALQDPREWIPKAKRQLEHTAFSRTQNNRASSPVYYPSRE